MKLGLTISILFGSMSCFASVLPVQDQDPQHAEIQTLMLRGVTGQKQAIGILAKIPKVATLQYLISVQDQVALENNPEYCRAIGNLAIIDTEATGEVIPPDLIESGASLVGKLFELGDPTGECAIALAKTLPPESNQRFEELIKEFGFSSFSQGKLTTTLRSLNERRKFNFYRGFDKGYLFSPEFKDWFKKQGFSELEHPEVRLAYLRATRLAGDSWAGAEFIRIMRQESDPESLLLIAQWLPLVGKDQVFQLKELLAHPNHRVVVGALETVKQHLNDAQFEEIELGHLARHPKFQVRAAYLRAVADKIDLAELRGFLSDTAKTVRRAAHRMFIQRLDQDSEKLSFAGDVLAGKDINSMMGIMEATELSEEVRAQIFSMGLKIQDDQLRFLIFAKIQEQKIESMYDHLFSYVDSGFLEDRYPGVLAAIEVKDQQKKERLLAQYYRNSLWGAGYFVRKQIIDYLVQTKIQSERELLQSFYESEPSWQYANQINEALVSWGMAEELHKKEVWLITENSSESPTQPKPRIVLETNKAKLTFELDHAVAPLHVREVLGAVRKGQWDGLVFHRVEDTFVIQASATKKQMDTSAHFIRGEVMGVPQVRGTLAAPRGDWLHGASAEGFYVNLSHNWFLNEDYTYFGYLVSDQDALDLIEIGDRVVRARVLDETPQ